MILMSIFLGLSTNSFLSLWILMEFNLLSFMIWSTKKSYKKTAMKYFFIQAFYSAMILSTYLFYIFWPDTIAILNLMMMFNLGKLGLPPLFIWFINLCSLAPMKPFFLICSAQKILPLMMLSNLFWMSSLWFMLAIPICCLGLLVKTHISKMLSHSSIYNMMWVIMTIKNLYLMFTFLLVYSMNFYVYLKFLLKDSKETETSINNSLSLTPMESIFLFLMSCNLAGLPPFIGFSVKLMTMIHVLEKSQKTFFLVMVIIAFSSFVLTYVYLLMIYRVLLLKKEKNKYIEKTYYNKKSKWYLMLFLSPVAMYL